MLEELREANEYIISKIRENDELVLEMEKYAEEHNVPIVTKEVAEYLKFIVRSNNIKNVLEVGTAIGYSGILMAKEIEKNNGKLYTIEIDENFDFVFIDASKGHYLEFFEDSYKLLNKNGIIFIDNIMFRGYLYKEYPKRFKTIVRRLNEFIEYLYSREGEEFVLLPFGDGIGLFRKKSTENTKW